MIIETKRLILREMTLDDQQDIYNIVANEIHKALKLTKKDLPTIFGSNDMYASSNSFEKTVVDGVECVEGKGDKDGLLQIFKLLKLKNDLFDLFRGHFVFVSLPPLKDT